MPSTSAFAFGAVFDATLLETRPGFAALRVHGEGAALTFAHEAGGHRWQRVPETEKRGRVHTSTVTVAVLTVPSERSVEVKPHDLDWKFTRSGGPGGQHANKTSSAVQLTHRPTGVVVHCQDQRCQHRNRKRALEMLRTALVRDAKTQAAGKRARDRKQQVGSGMRADKRRTIALQRDQVVDHVTGKRMRAGDYLDGKIDALWR